MMKETNLFMQTRLRKRLKNNKSATLTENMKETKLIYKCISEWKETSLLLINEDIYSYFHLKSL
jgi:hypothetical protein